GKAKEVWQKKKEAAANHYLDAEVYALAAADIIRALNMRKEDAPRVHQPVTEESVRGGWLRKTKGSWI
ncbi:MAG TPA: phage terminase large subunit family protein, partial [Thermotogota bacterium]|nr:phage terminase large subunit family protein [Thermotogota bacterium]